MVDVFGNSIIWAYTGGVSVKEIYANGVKVWPTVPPESYYIQWTPILSSGSFSIGGSYYNFSDYPDGIFYLSEPIITASAFSSNRSILTIDTNVLTINNNAFYNCRSLSQVSLPVCSYIGSGAFAYCQNLSSIYLDYSSVCRLDSSDAFQGTYITPYTGSIIVPFSLLDSYRTDSVWSYFFPTIYPDFPSNSYYIKWTPSVANGHMTFYSPTSTYNPIASTELSSWTSGYIVFSNYFSQMYATLESANITTFETNVLVFGKFAALKNISTLTYVNLYQCSSLAWQAFMSCSNLSYANIPKVTCVEEGTFLTDINLEYVNVDGCTIVEEQAFQKCSKLRSINLPYCSMLSGWAFDGCRSLSIVSIPNCKKILQFTFDGCYSLSEIDLPQVSYISNGAFQNCSNLRKVTLRSNSVVQLYSYGSNAFIGTPLYNGQGSIYVPSSLVSAYQTASKWSHYSSLIYPIE